MGKQLAKLYRLMVANLQKLGWTIRGGWVGDGYALTISLHLHVKSEAGVKLSSQERAEELLFQILRRTAAVITLVVTVPLLLGATPLSTCRDILSEVDAAIKAEEG